MGRADHEPRGDSRPRLSSRAKLDRFVVDIKKRSLPPLDNRGRLSPRDSWLRCPGTITARPLKGFVESESLDTSTSIGVLVADSNQMQCQLLVSALRRRPELIVTSCVLDPDAILQITNVLPVQVAILNADNPRDGWPDMTVVRRLHVAHPEVAQIILRDNYDRDIVVNAFRSGARGLFCFSQYPFRLLCKCIQSVHGGQVWANSEQKQYLVEALSQVPSLHMVNSRGMRLLPRAKSRWSPWWQTA